MQATTKDLIATNRGNDTQVNFKPERLVKSVKAFFFSDVMKADAEELQEKRKAARSANGIDYAKKKRLRKISEAARRRNRR